MWGHFFWNSWEARTGFFYATEPIPEVTCCRYLGFWFDSSGTDCAAASHLVASFQSAASSWVSLLRKMKISPIPKVTFLGNSLLFSIPQYYAPLFCDFTVVSKLNKIFLKSVRSFIGLPNGVSNNLVSLLFPELDMNFLFVKAKLNFLTTMSKHSPTVFPLAPVYDRCVLFPRERGFSFALGNWLSDFGVPDLIDGIDSKKMMKELLFVSRAQRAATWSEMSEASSTSFLCEVFCTLPNFDDFVLENARISSGFLRLSLLIWTGNLMLAQKPPRRSCPFCPLQTFTAYHFFSCPRLSMFDLEFFFDMARAGKSVFILQRTLERYLEFSAFCSVSPFTELELEVAEYLTE